MKRWAIWSWTVATLPLIALATLLAVGLASGANTLTITFAGSLYDTNTGTHTVTATPVLNDLIVILTANTGNAVATAPTDNAQGGTYLLVATSVKAASADRMALWVRQSLIMDGVSTIFSSAAGTTTGGGLTVWRVAGAVQAGSAAVLQSAFQSNVASGTPAPVFTRVPIAQDAVIAAMTNAASPAAMTPRAGYTEDVDVGYATPTTGVETMYRASGEASATITWGSSSASAFSSVAIELYAYQVAYPSLIASAAEGAGANCANAGQKITYGLDNGDGGGTALDGTLQAGEVDTTVYVCNGAAGAAGAAGFNSLVKTTVESPGANCAAGGTKIESGLDNGDGGGTARDGILQAGEVDATAYACNGATGATGAAGAAGTNGFNSLILIASEAQGANCANPGGGISVKSGLDNGDGGGTARDGILQAGEVDAGPFYVCNGATGATGATGAPGATGATGSPGANGADGFNSLVKFTAESAGIHCTNAGIRVDSGLDNGDVGGTARNGILEIGEIDATGYACNGAPGTNGAAGHNALVSATSEAPGLNCLLGGTKIQSGTDANDDGILQAGEVSSTGYACNGLAGATGATGATGPIGLTGPTGPEGPAGTAGASPVWIILVIPLATMGCLIVASVYVPRRK